MSLNKEQAIFIQHVAELIRKAPELGLTLTGGELFRTPEQQALHIKNGRSKTMNSQHLKRLAIDLNFFEEQPDGSLKLIQDGDKVRNLGAFWESLDPANKWGGNWSSFKDMPHFERRETGKASTASASRASSSSTTLAPTVSTSAATPAIKGIGLLSGSVGVHCQNSRTDVETVQRLINLNATRMGLSIALTCDGLFGEKTVEAIKLFQETILNVSEPDGIVQPGGATLKELCVALPESLNKDMLALIYLNAEEKKALNTLADPIIKAMERYGINTPLRQAHYLAQVGHESGELRFRTELASGKAYENRKDLGNIHPGDGPLYKGRGLIQLTGRANYSEYQKSSSLVAELNLDIVANPELIAVNDQLCADVACWFWDAKKLNSLADRDDLDAITRRINGGLNGLSDRRRLLVRSRTLLGV
ncbi:MAG: M15 family metallopeptidase [Methylobacter sp.]